MSKYLNYITFISLSCAPFFTSPVLADSILGSDFSVSANVGIVSEYSFRGIAQSDEHVALQGGFDLSHEDGLYAGLWGSNVDFNDGDEAHIEIDLYGGFANQIERFSYDLGMIYYAYPGADTSLDYDFWEIYLGAGYDLDLVSLSGSLNYSPDYFASSGDSYYYKVGVDVPLPHDFNIAAHIAYQEIDDNAAFGVPDYYDWSLGLGYTYEGFDFSIQYIDTDLDEPSECADGCDQRVIFGISKSF